MQIRRALSLVGVLAAVAIMAGCSRAGKPVLHVFNWSDYIKEDLVKVFEEKYGCRVVMDFYDSNETMYAKVKAGGGGYDVIFPSSYMVSIMHGEGMLMPIDRSKVPNLKYIDPDYTRFTMDPGSDHSVPYMISNSGIGYLKSRVPEVKSSWGMFDDASLAGRMTLMNDMRETIGAALKFLGYSLNTTNDFELAEARDVVIRWKKNIAKFESEQYRNGLASAEFLLCHGYNGDVMQVMEENDDVGYVIPEEGTSLASDDMVIPKDARNPDLAHAFINFLHEPEVAAENTAYIFYLCPNTASYKLLDAEVLEDPTVVLPEALLAKCEVIRDLGELNEKYTKVWDEIKAAQ
ncbi:MAG: spermidine/putrescine ABC transporter substrate-binding protein [Lentisphaerae bacterium]|nr:spermidine/putrescine ABC transporter substrate-binding protein [Lentisphaerota bacterium]